MLPDGKRKMEFMEATHTMFSRKFAGRILPFDIDASIAYTEIASSRRLAGKPISQFDAQITAIARSRSGEVATRNADDFEGCGVNIINPWD